MKFLNEACFTSINIYGDTLYRAVNNCNLFLVESVHYAVAYCSCHAVNFIRLVYFSCFVCYWDWKLNFCRLSLFIWTIWSTKSPPDKYFGLYFDCTALRCSDTSRIWEKIVIITIKVNVLLLLFFSFIGKKPFFKNWMRQQNIAT